MTNGRVPELQLSRKSAAALHAPPETLNPCGYKDIRAPCCSVEQTIILLCISPSETEFPATSKWEPLHVRVTWVGWVAVFISHTKRENNLPFPFTGNHTSVEATRGLYSLYLFK